MGRRNADPQRLRERRDERAFLFTHDLGTCLGELERHAWQSALSMCGGETSAGSAHRRDGGSVGR